MKFRRSSLALVSASLLALTLSACGSFTAPVAPRLSAPSAIETQGVPSQKSFVTIKVKVSELLPDDNHGLPHQNFIVTELSPNDGEELEVNNDTKYGSKVPLKVGDALTIRGVIYHGKKRDGIHWTHKANKPNDAGYIQTADGTKYQ